ncbi:MAG: hypothetical protein AAF840_17550, partial [Bacteroidota bacterium]
GVYITDQEGNIIQHINKQKGLLNNTILSMHYSPSGKLWLGMDFGLAAIDLWSDMTYYLDEQGQVGTGQIGLIHNDIFYLGTNQGLYYTDWEALDNDATSPEFRLVPGSSGQVWALSVIKDQLLCGHNRGLFQVSPNRFHQLHDEAGVLTISPLGDQHLLTGNYNGISLFQQVNNTWEFTKKIPPVQGACNQILPQGTSSLWLNLPNFGVIKATLDADFTITEQRIFSSTDFVGTLPQLYQEGNQLNLETEVATYQYQAKDDSFLLTQHLMPAHQVINKLAGIYRPVPLTDKYGFLPVSNGFALKNVGYNGLPPLIPPLAIRSVEAFNNDSTRLIGPGAEVPHRLNNIRIYFIVPHQEQVRYQYHLENHKGGWSDWSPIVRRSKTTD